VLRPFLRLVASIRLQQSAVRELSLYVLILALLIVLLRGRYLALDSIIHDRTISDSPPPLRERPERSALQVVPRRRARSWRALEGVRPTTDRTSV